MKKTAITFVSAIVALNASPALAQEADVPDETITVEVDETFVGGYVAGGDNAGATDVTVEVPNGEYEIVIVTSDENDVREWQTENQSSESVNVNGIVTDDLADGVASDSVTTTGTVVVDDGQLVITHANESTDSVHLDSITLTPVVPPVVIEDPPPAPHDADCEDQGLAMAEDGSCVDPDTYYEEEPTCVEDDPCWNCETMGNGECGEDDSSIVVVADPPTGGIDAPEVVNAPHPHPEPVPDTRTPVAKVTTQQELAFTGANENIAIAGAMMLLIGGSLVMLSRKELA